MTYTLRPAVREDLEAMMAIGHEGIRPYVEALLGWNASDREPGFREHFTLAQVSIVRGAGTGGALIRDLIARARSDGMPLRLRALQPNPAQRLYERLGFRRTAVTATHVHMEFDPITIERADLLSETSRALIRALNDELSALYSEPGANHFHLDPAQVTGGRGAFFVVRRGDAAVGCGALRLLDAETAELKRMYVAPVARGTGLGRHLVDTLEAEARKLGVRRLVLETGVRQEAALALYRATGFEPIPLFGEYCLSPDTSVCLGKVISARDAK